jgi:Rieske Fe-S protein
VYIYIHSIIISERNASGFSIKMTSQATRIARLSNLLLQDGFHILQFFDGELQIVQRFHIVIDLTDAACLPANPPRAAAVPNDLTDCISFARICAHQVCTQPWINPPLGKWMIRTVLKETLHNMLLRHRDNDQRRETGQVHSDCHDGPPTSPEPFGSSTEAVKHPPTNSIKAWSLRLES